MHDPNQIRSDIEIPGTGTATSNPVSTHLTVRPWWEPELAATGHDPRSVYAERFWLPVVGPSTLLLVRRFARGLEEHPAGFRVPLPDTARALGLGAGTGRGAPVNRSIDRACTFGLARRSATAVLEVRTHLPSLSARQLDRLPAVLQQAHRDLFVQIEAGATRPRQGRSPAA